MCIAFPFEVIKVDNDEAVVQYEGVEITVNTALLEDVNIGDYVLVHAGCAIEKLDREEGRKTEELFNSVFKDVPLRTDVYF